MYFYDKYGRIAGEITNDNYYVYYRGTELLGSKSYSGDVNFYRIDGHGSVTAVLSPTGEELKTYNYDAFGAKKAFIIPPMDENTILLQWKAETDGIYNPFGYCGEYTDQETGLIYLRNRYYSPNTGRFITEDPIRDGLNWYVYCGNNPVMFVDPWGFKFTKEEKENLTEDELKRLEQYQVEWNEGFNNNDQQKMDAAHMKAEMLRDTYRGGGTLTINSAQGHAWITYKTSQGETFTLGTWGNMGDNNKRLLVNVEKNAINENGESYKPYVYKTVSITEGQTGDLLDFVDKMVKNGSWTLSNNCAYFAATAWKKAGQTSLVFRSKGGYADPAILYYSIANGYRRYGKSGSGVIGPGQTENYSSTQEQYGNLLRPLADTLYNSLY